MTDDQDADLLDEMLTLAPIPDLLEAVALLVAPAGGVYGRPAMERCDRCGCDRGYHERYAGRCNGGLDPCMARCEQYVQPESALAGQLRRAAAAFVLDQARSEPSPPVVPEPESVARD